MSAFVPPLTPFENKARIHAHVAFFAYLVGLPLGICIARYLRTFTSAWFWPHAVVNFLLTGPLIFAAFALGYQTTAASGLPHFTDPHQKVGLALLVLYLIQVFLGCFIHLVKFPHFPGGRPPQNYLHAVLGLAIVVLAMWQTHYGLWTEWGFITLNLHPVNMRCRHFWLAIVVHQIVASLYALGLLLLPRQFRQEANARRTKNADVGQKNSPQPLI
ncbi:hypothetical protein DFH08DRAFT_922797 [Mycena albidolilacea]|uniref:Cytochrome b561 domain-containing protein n=1 Tax=Mycena albidolilacea TaxID=1033008 RepID=A0AAD7AB74_9AGAR|nr:hypothetical protein DFH08DRAFT_922797 [Mycena albidolilacea]